jgi:hypothetical protein
MHEKPETICPSFKKTQKREKHFTLLPGLQQSKQKRRRLSPIPSTRKFKLQGSIQALALLDRPKK